MVHRTVETLSPKDVEAKLGGWRIFPRTDNGAKKSVKFMSGKSVSVKDIEWSGDKVTLIIAGDEKVWGQVPDGATGLYSVFSVYSEEDVDSEIYYRLLVDDAELFDVAVDEDGAVIGNIYVKKMEEDEEGGIQHAISVILDGGIVGIGHFSYNPDSPIADIIVKRYAAVMGQVAGFILRSDSTQSVFSEYEVGVTNHQILKVLLMNEPELNEAQIWVDPVKEMEGWKVFIPLTLNSLPFNLNQPFTQVPKEVTEQAFLQPEDNLIPWMGATTNLLARPDMDDIRNTTYSQILLRVEQSARRILPYLEFGDDDQESSFEFEGHIYTTRYGFDTSEASDGENVFSIFAHKVFVIQKELDRLITADYLSLNETDVYTKDIEQIARNIFAQIGEGR